MDIGISITDQDVQRLSELEGWTFDQDRQSILKSLNTIDIQACPGSGKTTLIAAKLILLSQQWMDRSRGICVLSHTNVAKNEIIDRLKKSKVSSAQKLLNYPHFIGTIQEFVNRFIAIPLLKTKYNGKIIIDNDTYTEFAWNNLSMPKFSWLKGTMNGLGDVTKQKSFLRNSYLCFDENEELYVNIYPRSPGWNSAKNLSKARCQLMELKRQLGRAGTYLFRDMYTISQLAFKQTTTLPTIISSRFPLVLIDEMQDTQLHQDEVLLQAFGAKECHPIVQRFGDPDQAIYHGSGSEESNKSYNNKVNLDFVVNSSHRFNDHIASQIKCLSLNQVELTSALSDEEQSRRLSECSCASDFQNTIITHDCNSRHLVIEKFSHIIDEQFTLPIKSQDDFIVKILGAVGKPIQKNTDLKISSYWANFVKEKSHQSFEANTLLSAVQHCQIQKETDWSANYKIVVKSILKLLETNGRRHSVYTLRTELADKNNFRWQMFRRLILGAILMPKTVEKNWEHWISNLLNVLNVERLNLSDKAKEFLSSNTKVSHDEVASVATVETGKLSSIGNNCLKHKSGFTLQFSTIHGVKGETHDATLILPTKYHEVDMQKILPYLVGDRGTEGKDLGVRNKKFMKQFYVAASRPRHLLCMAIDKEHLSDLNAERLKQKGWIIVDASTSTTSD